MKLLREITQPEGAEEEAGTEEQVADKAVLPEDGWNVGHLANHGILLSAEGFSLKLDLDQLNALFDLAEDGESGEVMDHKGQPVYVEVQDDKIILTRDNDETYPHGVIVDLDTLKEMGIEKHEDSEPAGDEEAPAEDGPEEDEEPEEVDDTIDSDEEEIQEGVKRAFRRQGKKIKRGFRVTSGFRKGRVVANIKNAFKPRKPARTRTKLKIAARRKKIVRILKSKRSRRKPISKRLVKMNKRLSGK